MTTQTHSGGAVSRFFRLQPVTAWLITANLAVYAATVAQSRSLLANHSAVLFQATALYPPLVAAHDEWWRLMTSAFQHFGPMHLLLNMYMLWILGLGVERSIGHARFLALYLVSALGGSAAVMFYGQNALTAGASGAIFGLMGAYAIVAMSMRVDVKGIGILLVLNIGVSFLVPGVSLAAHLGGLLVGALGALVVVSLPRRLPRGVGRGGRQAVSWLGYLVLVALVATAAWYAADTMSPGLFLRA
ncbi:MULTISPECIES: rhomboid family intramembrane serine protease [unclassified Dietzia]|uniref:rhomboid family intramembrane serine protease n=1 Tax=unclassified Dietzia TaxID=2617939 RepID=UPI000D22C0D7|nr:MULTISPECIES: rhomboid family intramembrane serine protease [unclassified Dietzia]AVZ38133.1 rhomboid family intramembrane serine protease [Dietzia sp. JS16-p6b]